MRLENLFALTIVVSLLVVSCKTKDRTTQHDSLKTENLETLAHEMYGEGAQILNHAKGDFSAICSMQKDRPNSVFGSLQVSIIDIESQKVLTSKSIANCSKYLWRGDSFVAIENAGIVKRGESSGVKEHIVFDRRLSKLSK